MLELVGGFLLLIGLFTRPIVFVLSAELAFAYFIAHAPSGAAPIVNDGKLAVVYCFASYSCISPLRVAVPGASAGEVARCTPDAAPARPLRRHDRRAGR